MLTLNRPSHCVRTLKASQQNLTEAGIHDVMVDLESGMHDVMLDLESGMHDVMVG